MKLKKLISLFAGVVAASVLALPAAAGGKPADAGQKGGPSPCIKAVREAAKSFHDQHVDAVKAFHAEQKAAREAFRAQQPAPTEDQRKAFNAKHVAAVKAFHDANKAAHEAFVAKQKAAREACKAPSSSS